MTYSVNQPWDPLKVCVVGRSYSPEFYSFISNPRLRSLFERIATETEEDFQHLISTLKKFNVEIVRPNVPVVQIDQYITKNKRIPGPISMNPRDQMIMIGNKFFVYPYDGISIKVSGKSIGLTNWTHQTYNLLKGENWPQEFTLYENLPIWIQDECKTLLNFDFVDGENHDEISNKAGQFPWWSPVTDMVENANNEIVHSKVHDILNQIPSNGITRIGKDLYFGMNKGDSVNYAELKTLSENFFKDYRCHFVTTGGHIDGCFTPIKPGLIVSIKDISTYADTFPGWEVVYLEGESWTKVEPFLHLKEKKSRPLVDQGQ